jgi:hypothetical protein
MSFSKLANRELKVGEKIRFIPGYYNRIWYGILEYIGDSQVKMIKPDEEDPYIIPGQISIASWLEAKYENIKWKRVGRKKNHLPSWL